MRSYDKVPIYNARVAKVMDELDAEIERLQGKYAVVSTQLLESAAALEDGTSPEQVAAQLRYTARLCRDTIGEIREATHISVPGPVM